MIKKCFIIGLSLFLPTILGCRDYDRSVGWEGTGGVEDEASVQSDSQCETAGAAYEPCPEDLDYGSTDVCGWGYELNGPDCVLVDCGLPESPASATVSTPEGTTYNKTAIYTCLYDLTLVGENTRTCQADGTWSGSTPACVAICGDGKRNGSEICDPSEPHTGTWRCSPDCTVSRTVYPVVTHFF